MRHTNCIHEKSAAAAYSQSAVRQLRRRPQRSQQSIYGFTLIEVMVVIIVLGIVSALVVPTIGSRDDLNASAAARTIMSDLLYAQNRAISTQQTIYIKFDTAGQTYSLYGATPLNASNLLTHPVLQSPYTISLGSGAATNALSQCSLASAGFNGSAVLAFDESGAPYSFNTATSVLSSLSGAGSVFILSGSLRLNIQVAQDTGDITVR